MSVDTSLNLTAKGLPKAPAVIHIRGGLLSASDFGGEQMRKIMEGFHMSDRDINTVMAARTLAKISHGYKDVVLRRSGERYFDHVNGVTLMLLFEFMERDAHLLAASENHDVLEDVKVDRKEMGNLLGQISEETLRIVKAVTNPEKTGDTERDSELKTRHYMILRETDDIRISKLKVADRCYNLRCLEIMQLPLEQITEKHIQTAEKQIEESEMFIMPIAERAGAPYVKILDQDICDVIQQVQKIKIERLQSRVQSTTSHHTP